MPIATRAFAAVASDQPLRPYSLQRRDPGPADVVIDIQYCGVCHSDLHAVKNDSGGTRYPLVPGHEIVGVVIAVGDEVARHKVGNRVGVGCMVDSCRTCPSCAGGEEQYCQTGTTWTYASRDPGGEAVGQTQTQGGYSDRITVDQAFVLSIPDNLPLDAAAPLLCAGVTTYSPLRHWKVGPGSRVAVVGLGGLGHMAVKLAVAMGAEVTVISTSDRKKADAERMGARHFLINRDREAMKAAMGRFDLIINTVSATHEISGTLSLLGLNGTMVMLGLTTEDLPVRAMPLIMRRRSVAGSLIGGIRETQEMLDFCGQHNITSEIELIAPDEISHAYERMERSDVRYRFVVDMSRLTTES